ncbi:MAG: mechanosensitive ion channel [Pirellulaceae bacterium]
MTLSSWALQASTSGEVQNTLDLLGEAESILEEMKLDVDAYLFDLYQVADVKQQTLTLTMSYRRMIDQHVLWIRSSDQLSRSDGESAMEAFRWLVDYRNWRTVGETLVGDVRGHSWWYVLFLCGMAVLIGNQAHLRRTLGDLGTRAEKKNCFEYSITVRAVLLTVLISIPVPLVMLFTAWRLAASVNSWSVTNVGADFTGSLAGGLMLTAAVFFPMEFLRQFCRLDGLGIKHFAWDKPVARTLATNLRWLLDLSTPLIALIAIISMHTEPRWESSLGRAAFILLMPLLSIFYARIFRPSTGVFSQYLKQHPGGWLDRLRWFWYSGLVLAPLSLAVLSFVGYHYTAMRFARHISDSLWSAVVLVVLYFLAKRWLVLNRRKLKNAQARQRLEDAAKREVGRDAGLPTSPLLEKPEINLADMNDQTKRLLTSLVVAAGLLIGYMIWSDILPAVSFLDNFTLWSVTGSQPDETVRITLSNLVLVMPIVVLLFVAGRNVPGLLEIALLQHLPLTGAARYAITTLTRYFIIAIGVVAACYTLGLQWSSIQWLVAALGVGLGFGLQEIFANFVSGVILLFEQPIRVGDMITVDGTTGTVLKIRMRATTILNWDRQELIVPNKDLITGKLLNWTLTDSTNRIVVNVGVAYGSDTQEACELIRKVCAEHKNILREPATAVTFEGFGDNSLNLVVRAYLDSLEHRLQTIHELHQQIYLAFNAAGIEIAFPQRDLHIRSLPDSLQSWLSRKAGK